ncbi:Dihydroorotate dehydrogenase (quinone), mitochondrial [Blastocladiella emersonii ATCC 22665]|nr:Dihydroorotate dehydrogenase (quinone), mitochondrial [Blastocladiella emersonii ATCC 22665]
MFASTASASASLARRAALRSPSLVAARRTLSSDSTAAAAAAPWVAGAKTAAGVVGLGLFAVYAMDSRAGLHKLVTMPLVRACIDPEVSHTLSVRLAKWGLAPRDRQPDDKALETTLWGKRIANPVGLAAGFDKHAECIDGMMDMGFATVEIGSVTPKPQPGNPKPRVFRLPEDGAVINRYGFNSDGHQIVLQRLQQRVRSHRFHHSDDAAATEEPRKSLCAGRLLGVNLGKNKSSAAESHDDYVRGVRLFAREADYLVVNVSSPNTPGLRALQRRSVLRELMQAVVDERNATGAKTPICVKIAPDMTDAELADVAAVALETGIDGLIVSNTTVQRPAHLKSEPDLVNQAGGLSGAPVFPLGLRAVAAVRREVGDKLPIIGCGGIRTAREALAYARAGAKTVQLYTGLALDGPGVVADVKDGVARYLNTHGLVWDDVVGADARGVKLPEYRD